MRLRLFVLFFVLLFSFMTWASADAASDASPAPSVLRHLFDQGELIPDLDYPAGYPYRALLKYRSSLIVNGERTSYFCYFFRDPPSVTYGGYGYLSDELHFTGHLGNHFLVYVYLEQSKQWVALGGQWGLFNLLDLDRGDKVIMSDTTILKIPENDVFYYTMPLTINFEYQAFFSSFVQFIYFIIYRLVPVILLLIGVKILVSQLLAFRQFLLSRS